MKTWLFAVVEASIAMAGLVAYFWAENTMLAGVAAVAAALIGIAHPIMAARAAQRMQVYQEEMFDESSQAVDEQIEQLQQETVAVPFPHRQTAEAVLNAEFTSDAASLVAQFARVVKAIEEKSFAAEELAAAFSDKVSGHPLAVHLCGLAALSQENAEDAHAHFTYVTSQRPGWISPWLGWASAAWQLGELEEITQRHPHLNGVEHTPYDVGNEQTFIDLSEEERDALVEEFQATARALGNYYTMAEFAKSKSQIERSRQRLRRAA